MLDVLCSAILLGPVPVGRKGEGLFRSGRGNMVRVRVTLPDEQQGKRGKGWEEEGKRKTSMKGAVSSFTKTCVKPAATTQNERFTVKPDIWCE